MIVVFRLEKKAYAGEMTFEGNTESFQKLDQAVLRRKGGFLYKGVPLCEIAIITSGYIHYKKQILSF